MALAWIDNDLDEADDEDLHGRLPSACVMYGWDLGTARNDALDVQWAHSAQAHTRQLHSQARLRSLLNELRHTLAALNTDALRGWSQLALEPDEEQLLRAALEVTSAPEPETATDNELIDWREANVAQWNNGIRATLGADGEPLAQIRVEVAPQIAVEAGDDEILDD